MSWDLKIEFTNPGGKGLFLKIDRPPKDGPLKEAKPYASDEDNGIPVKQNWKEFREGRDRMDRIFERVSSQSNGVMRMMASEDLHVRIKTAREFVNRLIDEGTRVLDGLLSPSQQSKLGSAMREALQRAKVTGRRRTPVLEVHFGKEFFFPLEFLPLMNRNPYKDQKLISSENELLELAAWYFPAANFIIRRVYKGARNKDSAEESYHFANRKGPIKAHRPKCRTHLCEYEAEGRAELNYLTQRLLEIADVENKELEPKERLLDSLSDQTVNSILVQCHHGISRADGADPQNEPELQFRKPCYDKYAYEVELKYLEEHLPVRRIGELRSLVVLNACHVARVEKARGTFASLLYERGHEAVITTETSVHPGLAANFAKDVYEKHFVDGLPAGEAFQKAILSQLTATPCNPVGLFYAYHGDHEVPGYVA